MPACPADLQMKAQFAGMRGEIRDSKKFGILGKGISMYLRVHLIPWWVFPCFQRCGSEINDNSSKNS